MTERVQKVVNEIKQQNLKFDAATYNALLLAYTRSKQQKDAVATLQAMIEDGFKPSVESFNIVLDVSLIVKVVWGRVDTYCFFG